jgi:cyclophilin family peptidyl-prolyl cis-trans isomerase
MGTDKRERQKAGRQARIEAARIAQQKADQRAKLVRFGVLAAVVVVVIGGAAIFQRSKSEETVSSGDQATTTTVAAAGGAGPVPPPPPGTTQSSKTISGETACPAADGSAERTTKFEKAPPMCIDPAKTYKATFDTNKGVVKVTLDAKGMPNTTNNFVVLSRYKYYDNTSLFRVDPSIAIIQGGSPHNNSANDPGPGYTIKDEGGKFSYKEGQLVMARTQQPDSSGAQFFLTTGPEVSELDKSGTYLLFGSVDEGLDVLKAIQASGVPFPAGSPMADLGSGPKDPVIVNKVTIEES